MHKSSLVTKILALFLFAFISIFSHAQSPADDSKNVKIIIPWPSGGANDLLGRDFAFFLGEKIGKRIVIDNKGGANGLIGAEAVARSIPDGNTIMFHSITSHATNAILAPKLPYDTFKDFAPVSQIASLDLVLVAHPSVPVKSISDLVALDKAKPRSISYASFGNGSMAHLAGELLNQKSGMDLQHVPYKGGGPALVDTLAGHVQLYFAGIDVALQHIQSGALVPIAVTGSTRSSLLPNVPKIAETPGLSDYEARIYYGIWVPGGTPSSTVNKLYQQTSAVISSPAFKKKIESEGFITASNSSPEKMTATMNSQIEILGKVIKQAKILP